jgi:hypothetical protein
MLAVALSRSQYAAACGGPYDDELPTLAAQVVSDDPAVRSEAIDALRVAGPEGLQALFAAHGPTILKNVAGERPAGSPDDAAWERIRQALDAVGGQRGCATSHLYWYTDLEQAKATARESGKPILSLRLLGKLTDEYSCANSRFFRSTLYANEAVSRALREKFVLHWQSVRPVPVVTIDFGDGRKLQRTVTGNSVHYVLDADGRPIDALPGLYGPQAFLAGIVRVEEFSHRLAAAGKGRNQMLAQYHQQRLEELRSRWVDDLRQLGVRVEGEQKAPAVGQSQKPGPQQAQAVPPRAILAARQPRAVKASRIAAPKNAVEAPIVAAVLGVSDESLARSTSENVWPQIARLHAAEVELDAASRNLIARQNPAAAVAAPRAITKGFVENPLVRMLANLQQAIALDTVRNEYSLHRQVHTWFSAGQVADLDALNERVYSELFLTPSSDPWLGLMPADTYTALENSGVVDGARHYNSE